MSASGTSLRKPHWYLIPVRVVLVTFVVTLLSFAVSLFLGILGTLLTAWVRGIDKPNLTIAYRHIAFPAAATVAAIVLVSSATMEIRHYRQLRALRQIEDQMERSHG